MSLENNLVYGESVVDYIGGVDYKDNELIKFISS